MFFQGYKEQSRRQQDHAHFPNSPGKLICWMGIGVLFSVLEMDGRMFYEITHSPLECQGYALLQREVTQPVIY
jgi:hypothetical protein